MAKHWKPGERFQYGMGISAWYGAKGTLVEAHQTVAAVTFDDPMTLSGRTSRVWTVSLESLKHLTLNEIGQEPVENA